MNRMFRNIENLRLLPKIFTRLFRGKFSGFSLPEFLIIGAATSFSLYMDVIPEVKVTHPWSSAINPDGGRVVSTTTMSEPLATTTTKPGTDIAADGWGWLYNSSTGNVWVNNISKDSKQVPYSLYGYE